MATEWACESYCKSKNTTFLPGFPDKTEVLFTCMSPTLHTKTMILKIIWHFLCQNKIYFLSRATVLPQQIAQGQALFDSALVPCWMKKAVVLLLGANQTTSVVLWSWKYLDTLRGGVVMCTVAVVHDMSWWVDYSLGSNTNTAKLYLFSPKAYSVFYLISSSDCGALNCRVKLICLDWFLAYAVLK